MKPGKIAPAYKGDFISLLQVVILTSTIITPQAFAEDFDQIIDSDQSDSVTLNDSDKSLLVEAGVTINPVTGSEEYALGGENARNWRLVNRGDITYSLTTFAAAIRLMGNSDVDNAGSLYGGNAGIQSGDASEIGSLRLINQQTGSIKSDSVAVTLYGATDITNAGEISARYQGISAWNNSSLGADSRFSLINSGYIQGDRTAVSFTGYENSRMENEITNLAGGRIVATNSGSAINLTNSRDVKITNELNATIHGAVRGIDSSSLYTWINLLNQGRIEAVNGAAAYIYDGSVINNSSTGVIEGAGGLALGRGESYRIDNSGIIAGTATTLVEDDSPQPYLGAGTGIYLGGTRYFILNNAAAGVISGGVHGIYQTSLYGTVGNGTINNQGTIYGAQTGITSSQGVLDIVNSGVIEGGNGTAIQFSQQSNHTRSSLQLQTGSQIKGSVIGAASGDTVLTLSGRGEQNLDGFSNFTQLEVLNADDRWRLSGTGRFSGSATSQGTLLVDGTLETPLTTIGATGTLGGTGVVTGNTQINGGTLSGTQGETLTFAGDLDLNAGQVNVALGTPGGRGLFNVAGNLSLSGALNVSDLGGFGAGIYRIFDYAGSFTDNGFALGSLPAGVTPADAQLQTSIDKQINLVNASGMTLGFWDGTVAASGTTPQPGDNVIAGGDGVWNNSNLNWTDIAGTLNSQWSNEFAVFQGQAGTVRVDNADGQVTTAGMQFVTDGYLLQGDALALSNAQTIVRVGDGTLRRASTRATIDNVLSGSGGLVKTDYGTLILNASNDYSGATEVRNGTLMIGDADHQQASLASAQVTVAADGTLSGYGQLQGSVINQGTIVTGDAANTSSRASLRIDGDVTNSGSMVLGNGAPGNTLTIGGDYTGDQGMVVFNSQLGGDDSLSDKLIVQGDTHGTSKVVVNHAGGSGAKTLNGIELIQVAGQSDGEFMQDGRIVAGAYDYRLVRGAGAANGNWYLSSTLDEGTGDGGEGYQPGDGAGIYRPESAAYAANMAAANTLFTNRLHDRLGETHYVDALTGEQKVTSMWLRNIGGHQRSSDSSGQMKTQANRYVMQLGGDIAQWTTDGANRYHLGVMAGYGNQQSNSRNHLSGQKADGSINGYSTGVYATWLQDNEEKSGAYIDTWAQYNWFDNTVKGDSLAAESYKSKGITASVETGYTWKVGEKNARESYYVQPQAQVIWMGVKADDIHETNGTRVSGVGDGNIQTRLGARAYIKGHSAMDDGKQREFQPFVEANWIHNTREFGSQLNGVTVTQKGTRNIGELKVGVEGQINPTVNLWGNVGQQMGGKGFSDTQAIVGVKVNF